MRVVYNNIIPFKGFKAITLWPWIFVRKGCNYTEITDRHERIHGKQQLEMLILFFYLWYGIEWLIKLIRYWNTSKAYMNLSFEREAYGNQDNPDYLDNRKFYAWMKYL